MPSVSGLLQPGSYPQGKHVHTPSVFGRRFFSAALLGALSPSSVDTPPSRRPGPRVPSPPLSHQPTAVQVLLPHSPETTFTRVTASCWLLTKHRDRSQRDLFVAFDVLTTLSTLKCWGLSLPHHTLLGLFPVGGHFFLVSFMRLTSCNYPLWLVFLRP